MSAIMSDVQPVTKVRKPREDNNNMVNLFHKKVSSFKLENAWHKRNLTHGDVLIASLELDIKSFFQQYYVEETPELIKKLSRIGFEFLEKYPDCEKFNKFSKVMYHKKFNIALNLYDQRNKESILTAIKIVERSIVDHDTAMAVLFSAIGVLMEK